MSGLLLTRLLDNDAGADVLRAIVHIQRDVRRRREARWRSLRKRRRGEQERRESCGELHLGLFFSECGVRELGAMGRCTTLYVLLSSMP